MSRICRRLGIVPRAEANRGALSYRYEHHVITGHGEITIPLHMYSQGDVIGEAKVEKPKSRLISRMRY